ncbi:MAG: hypothetical protein JJT95_03720 [Pararhodobacter sp.]|nr:hypothetical protein [Pararhodobacter sp.]
MPDARYMARMERVLEVRVRQQRKARRFTARRLSGVAVALLASTACFFLLKAATLAQLGSERFDAVAAPVAQGEGLPALRFWLAGPDPVSRLLAEALSPGVTTATGTGMRDG